MDASVSRKKFERGVAVVDPTADDAISLGGWALREWAYPHLRIVFTHPKSRREVEFRFSFDGWDQQPPSLALHDPVTGLELPWEKWPKGGWSAGNPHPTTNKPFLCLPGIREYHIHSSHLNDPWENYRTRASYHLSHILHRVWQRFGDTNG